VRGPIKIFHGRTWRREAQSKIFQGEYMKKDSSGCGVYLLILLLAAALLFAVGFHYRGRVLRYLYPLNYRAQVEALADEYELDRWLVFAIIRVESDFKARAESHAGARGLMQLMPSTAAWIAETAGFDMAEAAIWQPEANIRLGCWYLDWLRDYYGGGMVAGVAAYNAGMSNVDSWLADGSWDGTREALAGIPFAETRRYISHVYESYDMYRKLYAE
jgi:soluble lytic murein transglycosylase